MTENDKRWIKRQTSNTLIEILENESKMKFLKEHQKYKDNFVPRLNQLLKIIEVNKSNHSEPDLEFINKLLKLINERKLVSSEFEACNQLWNYYNEIQNKRRN